MSILNTVASKLFPEGDFQNIKANAPNQMSYNIDATRDLVKNQFFNPLAPAMAATFSLPYDTIQGIGRAFENVKSEPGILDYDNIPNDITFADIGKSIAAENPFDSLIGRTYGATLGLGDKLTSLGKTISDAVISPLNAYEFNPNEIQSKINAAKKREALNKAGIMSLDDAGLSINPYEEFTEKAKPGLNLNFAKQLGSTALGVLTGNPLISLFARGLGALAGRGGLTGIRGGVDLRGDTGFDTFRRSTSLKDFLQRRRNKRAREAAARRGEIKQLQQRIDQGDFGGNGGGGFKGSGGYGSSAERGAALHG